MWERCMALALRASTLVLLCPLWSLAQSGTSVPEEYSRGWRSVASSVADRSQAGVRVAYQPLSTANQVAPPSGVPPTVRPSTSVPPTTTPPPPPTLPAPTSTSTVVPPVSSGTCGYEPYRQPATATVTIGFQPLIPIVSTPPAVYVARGIFGQPVIYVPGQPVRNFLRYLGP